MRFLCLLTLLGVAAASWKAVDIDRTVDLSSQIVKISSLYTFENTGSEAERSVKVALTDAEAEKLAYISATIEGNKGKLKIGSPVKADKPGFQTLSIDLRNPVPQGKQVKIRVNSRFTYSLEPLPTKIPQSESQFVVYQGSAYVPSAYDVANQKTLVKTAQGGKTLSATTVIPSKQEQERISYGPYPNVPAFEQKPIKVHYENNAPFVVATLVERVIEVSHWGNIAVEEYIELVHKGAELEGTFSRLEFQMDRRGLRSPALQHFTTVLPATARDIYYRDEIGNISTSAVRIRANSVELDVRPRYPLFGGWKTSYVIGYNVPSEEYLYKKDNQYALKFKLFGHVFDNIVVEKLVTKIILPEKIRKIKLATPYPVERKADEVKPTYLDTTGRIVVILNKNNVIDEHSQTFTLSYEFDYSDMLREPLLATGFFFSLFLAAIIYSRFDFTLVSNAALEAEERLHKSIELISRAVDRKQKAYDKLIAAAQSFKENRDEAALEAAKKNVSEVRQEANEKINEIAPKMKNDSSSATVERALELAKYDKNVFDLVESYHKAVEKSSSKAGSQEEATFAARVKDARTRADNIIAIL